MLNFGIITLPYHVIARIAKHTGGDPKGRRGNLLLNGKLLYVSRNRLNGDCHGRKTTALATPAAYAGAMTSQTLKQSAPPQAAQIVSSIFPLQPPSYFYFTGFRRAY